MASINPSVAVPPDPGTLASLLKKLGAKPSTVNWAYAVLAQGGWPQTPSNVQFLQAWAAAEGGSFNNSYTYNVLNTGQTGYGGAVAPGGSFPSFPSWSDGVQATVATLNQKNGDYANITDALATGNATQQFIQGNLDSALTTWDPGASSPGGDITSMRENIGAPPVLVGSGTSSGGTPVAGGGHFTPSGPVGASGISSTGTASLLYDCYTWGLERNATKSKGLSAWQDVVAVSGPAGAAAVLASQAKSKNSTCIISIPGSSFCFTTCEAKALISGSFIVIGGILGLVSLTMMFSRGKGLLGKTAELAGAGVALVPGGEAVGGAMMTAGHAVSTKSKARAASKGAQKVVAKRQARQKASAQGSRDDQDAAIHAQGFASGQAAGRNTPLRPRQHSSRPSSSSPRPRQHASTSSQRTGAQFADMTPGAEF